MLIIIRLKEDLEDYSKISLMCPLIPTSITKVWMPYVVLVKRIYFSVLKGSLHIFVHTKPQFQLFFVSLSAIIRSFNYFRGGCQGLLFLDGWLSRVTKSLQSFLLDHISDFIWFFKFNLHILMWYLWKTPTIVRNQSFSNILSFLSSSLKVQVSPETIWTIIV